MNTPPSLSSVSAAQAPGLLDLEDIEDATVLTVLLACSGERVLDAVGADLTAADALTRLGCDVWVAAGAEAARGERWAGRVLLADLDALDMERAADGPAFDVILLHDLLEYATDPVATLQRLRRVLACGGRFALTIRNGASAGGRVQALRGRGATERRWSRDLRRQLDRADVDRLLHDAGLEVFEELAVARTPDESAGAGHRPVGADADGAAESSPTDANDEVAQFVLTAAPRRSIAGRRAPSLAALLQQRHRTASTRRRDAQRVAAAAEARLQERDLLVADLRRQVDALTTERDAAGGRAASLEASLGGERELAGAVQARLDEMAARAADLATCFARASGELRVERDGWERRARALEEELFEERAVSQDRARRLSDLNARIEQVVALCALSDQKAADLGRALDARADEVGQLADDIEHLRRDVLVKDAFIAELRARMQEYESARPSELEDVQRADRRTDAASAEVVRLTAALEAALGAAVASAADADAHRRECEARLTAPRYRLADRANGWLKRLGPLHRAIRRTVAPTQSPR